MKLERVLEWNYFRMIEFDVDFNIAEKEVRYVALFKFFARHNKKFPETTSLRRIERQTYFGVILSVGNTKASEIRIIDLILS